MQLDDGGIIALDEFRAVVFHSRSLCDPAFILWAKNVIYGTLRELKVMKQVNTINVFLEDKFDVSKLQYVVVSISDAVSKGGAFAIDSGHSSYDAGEYNLFTYLDVAVLKAWAQSSEEIFRSLQYSQNPISSLLNTAFNNRGFLSSIKDEIADNITHECGHLWQKAVNAQYRKFKELEQRLRKVYGDIEARQVAQGLDKNIAEILYDLSFGASRFIRALQSEGFAELFKLLRNGKIDLSDGKKFDELYLEVFDNAQSIHFNIMNIFANLKSLIENLHLAKNENHIEKFSELILAAMKSLVSEIKDAFVLAYPIGLHIAYALYAYGYSIDAIAGMSYRQYLAAYEEQMAKHGKLPVVSISNPKSGLDYAPLRQETSMVLSLLLGLYKEKKSQIHSKQLIDVLKAIAARL